MSKQLNAKNFDEEIANGVSLVDFWAAWCGPCKMLTPIIDEVANDYTGRAKIFKLNVDEDGEIAARYGIMSIPTIIVFKDGEVCEKSIGLVSKAVIEKMIDKYL